MSACEVCGSTALEKRGERRIYAPLDQRGQVDGWSEGDDITWDTDDDGNEIVYCTACDHETAVLPIPDPRAAMDERRKASGGCTSRIFHGPGHQSSTYCTEKGPHTTHSAVYGSQSRYAEWTGEQASSGFFDEAPGGDE